ncbi:MAG TPA: undecaprenyl-diphosphate phosphatase [Steroidobacteraceae bacterium]|nr:undecaprenyl-diphosphate phosphatase [Steroidobacteraceae bacterium]
MDNLLQVILLGVIEGITEFLPISSTGHLLIAQHWLGPRSELFTVAIQAGAILAVVAIYWQRLWQLTLNLSQPANRDYLFKLLAAFVITIIGGLAAKLMGLELPETVAPVAWALVIGGVAIFVIEAWTERQPKSDELTWSVANWVGIAQIVAAVFPGTSRSAATLFAAMLAGMTSRPAAAEFSFLLAIPTMFAATAYELLNLYRHDQLAQEHWTDLGVGFVVSAIVAFIAVKWLLTYIQTHRFTIFAWYRIVAGVALLALVR